ncbi:hypothetical protein BV898_11470 [Hypsibius exemplaris]|uniref:Uncharacterized protein n=1 Tax=Hypsibius exemplaris TaxID=2072580 RepID=A0A1W0WGP7_HYPEX|nr:hypothetical protein BV898_11470 [Hypsibius exemplaris]
MSGICDNLVTERFIFDITNMGAYVGGYVKVGKSSASNTSTLPWEFSAPEFVGGPPSIACRPRGYSALEYRPAQWVLPERPSQDRTARILAAFHLPFSTSVRSVVKGKPSSLASKPSNKVNWAVHEMVCRPRLMMMKASRAEQFRAGKGTSTGNDLAGWMMPGKGDNRKSQSALLDIPNLTKLLFFAF